MGLWDFEPDDLETSKFSSTDAVPGSRQKLDVLTERLEQGLPLWHTSDRRGYGSSKDD